MFALLANALAQPPDRRVIKEQGLSSHLEDVYEGVEALHMRQFMRDHRGQLVGR